jgi:acetyl esterase/lipase
LEQKNMTDHTLKVSRSLVDPEILPFLEAGPDLAINADNLGEIRANYPQLVDAFWGSIPADMSDLELTDRAIPGEKGDPDVRILILSAKSAAIQPRPAFLEIHGGGHIIGTAEGNVRPASQVVRNTGATAIIVDYRLSPETVYPGSLNDCHAALKWIVSHADEFGIDRQRIAISGGSAGGTLAAGLALLNRDRENHPICHLHLINPMLDDRTATSRSASPYVGEYGWTRACNSFGWTSLLGVPAGSDGVSPYAAPGRMENLSGLPPTFINCGALDLFVDESIEFGRRLIAAGVPTEMHIYPGLPHGLHMGVDSYAKAVVEREDAAAWKRAFGCTQ